MQRPAKRNWQGRLAFLTAQFFLLLIFWLVLSGHFNVEYISFGVFSAALITLLSNDLFYSIFTRGDAPGSFASASVKIWTLLLYLPWLLSRIVLANLQVAYLVLHPRMPVDPGLLRFRTRMRRHLAQVILANSITLTPGTITLDLQDGSYIVHAIAPSSAGDLLSAAMQNKVGAIFREEKDVPMEEQWLKSLGELKE